jgi:hypothetical protein
MRLLAAAATALLALGTTARYVWGGVGVEGCVEAVARGEQGRKAV